MQSTSEKSEGEERNVFESLWLDYVLDLGGAEDADEAWNLYLAEKASILSMLSSGSMTAFRSVRLVAGADVEKLKGGHHAIGVYWTSDETVARDWEGNSEYSDVRIPEDNERFVIEGVIDAADVDIMATAACRLGSSWEAEIRLHPGCAALVTDVRPATQPGCLP